MILDSAETTMLQWFQPTMIDVLNITSPRQPHILALGTSSPHPSIASHLLFTYFLPRFPSVSSFAACNAPRCQHVKLRWVHCGCADLQLWPGLSHGTSWVIPTRDPILLCILLSNPPQPPSLRKPLQLWGMLKWSSAFFIIPYLSILFEPPSSSFSSPLTVPPLLPFPL